VSWCGDQLKAEVTHVSGAKGPAVLPSTSPVAPAPPRKRRSKDVSSGGGCRIGFNLIKCFDA